MFQSTPPHGRRHLADQYQVTHYRVFQSTPPHGRRPSTRKNSRLRSSVSIHASAREATGGILGSVIAVKLFQSTPPHGRRHLVSESVERKSYKVSIHASAREATRLRSGGALCIACFNPRLRTGGDVCPPCWHSYVILFQSTPPHGRRQHTPPTKITRSFVSIHASAREATLMLLSTYPSLLRFNPRLRTGGDRGAVGLSPCWQVSIHASAREATDGRAR